MPERLAVGMLDIFANGGAADDRGQINTMAGGMHHAAGAYAGGNQGDV
jgi:hypothetical protein